MSRGAGPRASSRHAPTSHILVVSDDLPRRDQIVAALNAAARPDDPVTLRAFASDPGEPVVDAVRRDGDLHVVLIDHHDATDRRAVHLAKAIAHLRPELSLYLMLEDDDTKLLVEELAGDAVDGYFFRSETDRPADGACAAAAAGQPAAGGRAVMAQRSSARRSRCRARRSTPTCACTASAVFPR